MNDYFNDLNKKYLHPNINKLEEYAKEHNVPIVMKDSLFLILELLSMVKPKRILEIGTAIGYSSICMAYHSGAIIDTIERNEEMYNQAVKNIKSLNMENRINVIFDDALLVNNNSLKTYDVIFIDASTTTLQIAEFLRDKKNITVITNGIPLATLLISNGIKTYSTGGEIFSNSLAHYGSFSEDFIQKFNIDTLILSSHGVNEKGMLIDPSLPETQIRKVALNQSRKSIFLCDKSKFSLSAPYNLISIKKMDYIITNNEDVKKFFTPDDKNKIIIV